MSADLLKEYKDATDNFIAAARAVPAAKLHQAPSNDEWSPANIIHHLADTEAHFYIRYLKILTEDIPTTDFFDENVYPTGSNTRNEMSKVHFAFCNHFGNRSTTS